MAEKKVDERDEKAKAIVERIKNGEQEAIPEFFELYSDDIYNFSMRFYNFTEDEAGDVYLYAFEHLKDGRKLSSFKGKSRFSTWFHSVLKNLTIDYLRTQKEKLRTTAYVKLDSKGNLVDALESISDESPDFTFQEELFIQFRDLLESLKMSQRVLFKLAYIHYIDLEIDEMQWLSEENNISISDIAKKLIELKELALKKEKDVRILEDKLTANFQQLGAIEEKIMAYFRDHPEIPIERTKWTENYSHPEIDLQILEKIHSLSKKKKKHLNLLAQQKKGRLSIRVPYKELSDLMGSSKGVLSVQLLRIIEKLNQSMENQ